MRRLAIIAAAERAGHPEREKRRQFVGANIFITLPPMRISCQRTGWGESRVQTISYKANKLLIINSERACIADMAVGIAGPLVKPGSQFAKAFLTAGRAVCGNSISPIG
jgi:hypothetical protein